MKKITFLLGMFFSCFFASAQTCEQIFVVEGTDNGTVLTVESSELNCYGGTLNSIKISDALLGSDFFCGSWYLFDLDIDGEVTTGVCYDDLIDMDITGFTTITITAMDHPDDGYEDDLAIGLALEVTYTANAIPNCDAELTSPENDATDVNLLGVLSWTAATGGVGEYVIKVGTTSGGTDVVDNVVVAGDVLTYDIPGMLAQGTQFFVTITPRNGIGPAVGCTEYSFTTVELEPGNLCENAIVVDSLPFSTEDTTENYTDIYYEGTPGASCSGNGYLNGNDVVYSYTATFTGSVKMVLTPASEANTWGGFFVYASCSDIGVNCLNGAFGSDASPKTLNEFAVVSGETYYIVISTWASPQTIEYTFDITQNTCSNGAATYAVVSDCANGDEQFLVNVNLTSLGTANSMTINDDQGSAPQVATAPGTFTFGPFANNTPVIFTINNDQDESCFLTSSELNQLVCPPSNDTCATAIDLANESSPLMATTVGATNTNLVVCNNSGEQVANNHSDVYYSILVPNGSTLEIGVTLSSYDTANVVFYGDCDNRTTIACYDDPNYTKVEWSNNTGADQTVYWVQDGWSGNGTFTLEWLVYACTPAEATYTVVSDCANGEQFLVEVDVTLMGSATSLSVSDDQGNVEVVNQLGVVTFGPYENNTPVVFTVANDQDEDCILTSPALNQIACPPSNDECAAAIALTAGGVFDDFAIETTNLGATRNAADHDPTTVTSTCDTFQFLLNGKDVWYTVEAPASGTLTIETATNADTAMTDTALYVYTGTCADLTYNKCSGDIGGGNNFSKVVLTDLTPGQLVTARVWGYNGAQGGFKISAYDASLSNVKFENGNFKVYPNPVKDVLNLSYNQNISNVEIFNMLGQQVLVGAVNATQGQVDMSNLASGAYLVKIAADNQIKTIKVIKQ